MSFSVTFPERGRGAWPSGGMGGTLTSDGTRIGRFFRAPAKVATPPLKIGLIGFRAVRDQAPVAIDFYAVHLAVKALQGQFGEESDGIWGPATDAKVKSWQLQRGLKADGVFGPKSARMLFEPICRSVAQEKDGAHGDDLGRIVAGHVNLESGWDPAAIGVLSPQDVGLGQINGPAHPNVTLEQKLDPLFTIRWMADFCDNNLVAMKYDVRDAVAAYNLGITGARAWIAAGRPDVWVRDGKPDVRVAAYIEKVLNF